MESNKAQKAKAIAEAVYSSLDGEPNERLAAYVNGFMDGVRSMADKLRKEKENGDRSNVHKDDHADA